MVVEKMCRKLGELSPRDTRSKKKLFLLYYINERCDSFQTFFIAADNLLSSSLTHKRNDVEK